MTKGQDMEKWKIQPQSCRCFGGYCQRHMCPTSKKKPRASAPRRKRQGDRHRNTSSGRYTAKPDDLRKWDRVWRKE